MDIFEKASRQGLRFTSSRGELTTEHLWQMPLKSRGEFDLDSLAKSVAQALRDNSIESFVDTETFPGKEELELKLDILKHIIEVKKEAILLIETRQKKAAQRAKILEILASKEDSALSSLSREDLLKKLEELDG